MFDPSTNSDATPQGVTGWLNADVENMLEMYGLPLDSALSVLCVEMMPGYDNFFVNERYHSQQKSTYSFTHNNAAERTGLFTAAEYKNFIKTTTAAMEETRQELHRSRQTESYLYSNNNAEAYGPRPLTSDLGNYRILRTSLLVAIPEVCCVNC